MQGLFFASPLLSSLLLLVVLLLSRVLLFSFFSSFYIFGYVLFSRNWRAYLSLSLSLPLLFPHFSLSLSHALARARGRHPVAFRLYLSATGCLCLVAQPLYIKRQGACYSPLPSSRANYVGLANLEKRQYRPYTRESVVESIPCRRAAFYLRPPYAFSFRLTLVLYPFPPSLPSIILHRSSRLRHPSSRFRTCFLPSFFVIPLPPRLFHSRSQ